MTAQTNKLAIVGLENGAFRAFESDFVNEWIPVHFCAKQAKKVAKTHGNFCFFCRNVANLYSDLAIAFLGDIQIWSQRHWTADSDHPAGNQQWDAGHWKCRFGTSSKSPSPAYFGRGPSCQCSYV